LKFDPFYPQKNVILGLSAGGPWKIVVVLTMERLVISTSNLVQGLYSTDLSPTYHLAPLCKM